MKVKLLVSKLRVHKGLIVLSCDTRTDLDLTLFALHPTVVQLHTPTIDQLKLLFKSMLVRLMKKKNIFNVFKCFLFFFICSIFIFQNQPSRVQLDENVDFDEIANAAVGFVAGNVFHATVIAVF